MKGKGTVRRASKVGREASWADDGVGWRATGVVAAGPGRPSSSSSSSCGIDCGCLSSGVGWEILFSWGAVMKRKEGRRGFRRRTLATSVGEERNEKSSRGGWKSQWAIFFYLSGRIFPILKKHIRAEVENR